MYFLRVQVHNDHTEYVYRLPQPHPRQGFMKPRLVSNYVAKDDLDLLMLLPTFKNVGLQACAFIFVLY